MIDEILGQVALAPPTNSYGPRNADLMACLLTSKTMHNATINTLFNSVSIPHSKVFAKFLNHIAEKPYLGSLVRRLDLSHFTSVGFGRSRQMNAEIQNLTSSSLLRCLDLMPHLQEGLFQEHLDDDMDGQVLQKLLFRLPNIQALDLCAASSKAFVDAMSATGKRLAATPYGSLPIRRLGLHECFTLPSTVFEHLLPRLGHLTHLDVAHTRVTDDALLSIPRTARLTHLDMGRCSAISGEGIADFLVQHPAASELVYLNLSSDPASYRLLDDTDLDRILPNLPASLASLNINGAKTLAQHLPHLIVLSKHLEELGLAHAKLSLENINALFVVPRPKHADASTSEGRHPAMPTWTPPALHYLDLSSVPSITQSSLFSSACVLLAPATAPLEVLELGDKAISSLRECRNTNKRLGWVVKELGRRGWYVRTPPTSLPGGSSSGCKTEERLKKGAMSSAPSSPLQGPVKWLFPSGSSCLTASASTASTDTTVAKGEQTVAVDLKRAMGGTGRRAWKMGAMWWGMRKIPVAVGEVGGLYGHYMFKK